MFVHTLGMIHAIIITVKTPQYIIWFLLHPIVKIPSPKKDSDRRPVFFTMSAKRFCSSHLNHVLTTSAARASV